MIHVTTDRPDYLTTQSGVVLCLRFTGTYPIGSLGNDSAKFMVKSLESAMANLSLAGVVIDCTKLEYRFGDAICGLAWPLRRPQGGFLRAYILAVGETRSSLAPLLDPHWLLGVAGVRLVDSVDEAILEMSRDGG